MLLKHYTFKALKSNGKFFQRYGHWGGTALPRCGGVTAALHLPRLVYNRLKGTAWRAQLDGQTDGRNDTQTHRYVYLLNQVHLRIKLTWVGLENRCIFFSLLIKACDFVQLRLLRPGFQSHFYPRVILDTNNTPSRALPVWFRTTVFAITISVFGVGVVLITIVGSLWSCWNTPQTDINEIELQVCN